MNLGEWIILGVYACIGVGLWYIIWQLGKERNDE